MMYLPLIACAGGPDFLSNHEIISSFVLPPPYSRPSVAWFLKNFKVGYPPTSNLFAKSGSSVASTLANLISLGGSRDPICWAAISYSGSRALQWPHHGASKFYSLVWAHRTKPDLQNSTNKNLFSATAASKLSFVKTKTADSSSARANPIRKSDNNERILKRKILWFYLKRSRYLSQ